MLDYRFGPESSVTRQAKHDGIRRRPAVAAAVLLVLGISLHQLAPAAPWAWIGLTVLAGVSAYLLHESPWAALPLSVAVVFAGVAAGQIDHFRFRADDISCFTTEAPRLATVEGTIHEAPRVTDEPQRGRPLPAKQSFVLDVWGVQTWRGLAPISGELPVTVSPPQEGLTAGQFVKVVGMLERPPPAMNPGAFDAAEHWRRQRVLAEMHVNRPYDVQPVVDGSAPGAVAWVRQSSRSLLDKGFSRRHEMDRALLAALVFGDRGPSLREVDEQFRRSGTAHLLSSNGTRIAILGGFFYLLFRLLRVSPRWSAAVVAVSVLSFSLLTLPAAQTIRPVIACVAVGVALIWRRSFDSLHMLALAAIGILVVRPLDLYGPGFQLAFVIVLGMILYTPRIIRWCTREDPDARVAKAFVPQSALQRGRDWMKRRLIESTVAAAVAWFVAIPLIAYHYEQFNLWTVPFSVVLAPLVLVALACGFLKLLLTAVCPPAAFAWATVAAIPAGAVRHVVAVLAAMPGADFPFRQPSWWFFVLFYGLLCLPLIPWPRRWVIACARCGPAGGAVMLLGLAGFAPQKTLSPDLRITLLSVGAGQCAVVEPPYGGAVVIDAGSSSNPDPLRTSIAPFLRHEGWRSIQSMFLSHGDFDHISEARQMVTAYNVREVFTSPHFRRHASESKPCRELLAALDTSHHSPRLLVDGDRLSVGSGVQVEVLWPPEQVAFNSNNAGLVLRLTYAGRSVLFPADIQEPAERELLKHPDRLRSDVLIAPHHGSSEVTSAEFVRAVAPKVILCSNAQRLTQKQKTFDQEMASLPEYRTSRSGALTIGIAGDGTVRVVPMHGETRTLKK